MHGPGAFLHAADSAGQHDAELKAMWIEGSERRLADMRRMVRAFHDTGFLRQGVTADDAADVLWALASPDTYRACTVTRGWTPRRYESWLATTVQRALMT